MVSFSEVSLDRSFGVNSPRTVNTESSIRALVASRKQALVVYPKMDVATAREIASLSVVNHMEWHLVESQDEAVWNTLLKTLEEDTVRIIGLFHGHVPDTVRSRIPILNVADKVVSRVPKKYIASLHSAIKDGKPITGNGWEHHRAATALCFEVIYGADKFKPELVKSVPAYLAQKFLQSKAPRTGWTDAQALNRVNILVSDVQEFRA